MVIFNDSIEKINRELERMNPFDRIFFACDVSKEMMILTSGGGKYSVVPSIVKKTIPYEKVPVIFIDIGCYDPATYQAIEDLREEHEVLVYQSEMSLSYDEAVYGKIFKNDQVENEEFRSWCIRRKKVPLDRAIEELNPDFLIGGRTRFQSEKRSNLQCLEKRGDVYQLNPIFDWDYEQIEKYMRENNLKGNSNHFDPTKGFDEEECPIWYYQI
jgi:3'-phosphoadenosine 5'-phosphosulfate sulfotransferase (PAPS reductase)/FAD synthetase